MPKLQQAQLRHASYYLAVLMEIDKNYYTGGETLKLGLDLFDSEWSNIQAGQSYAERYASADDRAAILCSNYPYWGAYILTLR
jgi:hypothetical protein